MLLEPCRVWGSSGTEESAWGGRLPVESLQGMPGRAWDLPWTCCSLEGRHGQGSQMAQCVALVPDPSADMIDVHRISQGLPGMLQASASALAAAHKT